jgi:hypothetical protein
MLSASMQQLLETCRSEPLVFDDLRPDLCPLLAEVILARRQRDHGRRTVGSLNVGGWKSGEDFFTWPEEPVQELRRAIVEAVGAGAPVGWAMVNRAGSQHPRHQHRAASLTGIYYVAAGSADALTPTVFECPCDERLARGMERYEMEVEPHPGRLVICRGESWHSVPKYLGKLPRITVAFDVKR